jgi:2-dehydro-3-deoxyphosphooctonate aldolase (KDO 8-P synthase)
MVKKSKVFSIGYGSIKKVKVGGNNPLLFIGGPCAIESRQHSLKMATRIKKICDKLKINYIFKSCYNKDSRSSPESFNGVGIDEGLDILKDVRNKINVPVISDFSEPTWAKPTGDVVDIIQIPAYLCRQTSILRAAAETKKPILIKKGQFMSPWNMKNSVRKLEYFGADKILLADRGTFFGYNMLVNDMRCFPIMGETGYPVCFDATHSVQMPTSMGNISGGQREFIPHLVRSATACGVDSLFMEVHDNPSKALSDPNTVLNIKYLERILIMAKKMHQERINLEKKFRDLNVE